MNAKPWYHRPEWIAVIVTVALALSGSVSIAAGGLAQTAQNARDIKDLKDGVAGVPERLARIEQKVDDLKLELRRPREAAD